MASNGDADAWVEYHRPPEQLPIARISELQLQPSQYFWRLDGKLESLSPLEASDVRINDLPSNLWISPTVAIDAEVRPLRAQLTYYALQEPGSIPKTDRGEVSNCDSVTNACSMVMTSRGTEIRINRTFDNLTLELLTLEYSTLESVDQSSGVSSYRISWVLRAAAP